MSPNPQDRISVGLWETYAKKWSGDFLSFLILPLLDFARGGSGRISQATIFAFFGILSAFTGIAGNMLMAINCRERIMLQPKPADSHKALFYILKNKYAMRNFVAGFVTGWWSNGGYGWDLVTQLEIFGGFVRTTIFMMPRHIGGFISLALIEPFKKLFGGSFRKTVIFMRSWDTLLSVTPAVLGFFPGIMGSWWKIATVFAVFDFLCVSNDAPSNVMEGEINREINDYTEYVTGERPDGSIGLLTNLASKLTDPLKALMTIAVFRWTGYDPNIGAKKKWDQNTVRENSTMYSKIFFLYKFGNILAFAANLIPLFMYDLEGKKKADMYAALNERRALVAQESAPEEMALLGMIQEEEAMAK